MNGPQTGNPLQYGRCLLPPDASAWPVTRVALIASARYPIREPFPGGLEAHTWQLAHRLRSRGHEVTVFGGPGSDPALEVRELPALPPLSEAA
ncbi:MAG: hypothetical protein QOH17_2376, partial [Pseudonocardiales bacterium]|nr:hypothetical protein [Pseudonocardiales bacterium]